jgi:serine/threonine protein kinase
MKVALKVNYINMNLLLSSQVVTQYYRAPELLAGANHYSSAGINTFIHNHYCKLITINKHREVEV